MQSCSWSDCQSSFKELSDLVTHINEVHLNDLKSGEYFCHWNGCDRATQSFHNRSSLCAHIRRHTGEKPFECSVCKSTFSRSDALSKHLKGHGIDTSAAESAPTARKAMTETLGPVDYILENLLLENMSMKRQLNSNDIHVKRLAVENAFLLEAIKDALQSSTTHDLFTYGSSF